MISDESDNECSICFDLMWYPCRAPCGHYICLECLESLLGFSRSCPMCRAKISKDYIPQIDKPRQKEIRKIQEEVIAKRAKEIQAQNLFCDTLDLVYGNTHKVVSRSDRNTHAWSAFVKLSDNQLDISKYIQKVVFFLHSTFDPAVREVTSAPFKVSLFGYGEFTLPIMVHWQPWLEREPTRLNHCISFVDRGDSYTTKIGFKKSVYDNVEEKKEDKEERRIKEREGKNFGTDTLTLLYGNIQGNGSASTKKYDWTIFVSLEDGRLDVSKYIEKVVFTLPKTYDDPVREVKKAPFEIECFGEGDFRALIVVHWKSWLEMEPTRLAHFVDDENSNSFLTNTVKFNMQVVDQVVKPQRNDVKFLEYLESANKAKVKPKPQEREENMLTIVYGNTHELLKTNSRNKHAWSVFVNLADKDLDISVFIEKVVFYLDPTFANPVREVKSRPFEVSCNGWGEFDMKINIHWQKWLEMETTSLNHSLSFEGYGTNQKKAIKLSEPVFEVDGQ